MIKTPRLPKEDFANFTSLSESVQREALLRHSTFVPDWTLEPFRNSLTDIFNVKDGMFEFSSMPWERVERSVRLRSKKSPDSEELNVGVAKAAWNWAEEAKIFGKVYDAEAVPLGGGWFLNYWHGFYLVVGGQVLLPFFDARKGASRVSIEAARLICSINNHYIARGRFRSALPVVVQFPESRGARTIKLIKFDKSELLSRDEFQPKLLLTANIWREVVAARAPSEPKEDPRQAKFKF